MSATFAKLPPPDAPAVYVIAPQGQLGPMPLAALLDQVAHGQVPPDAPIWFEGLDGWIRMGEHPELRDRLAGGQGGPRPGLDGRASSDDEQDRIFAQLIEQSWKHFDANLFASHVDEVFIGAVITATLDNGYALIDITSDGSRHYLRFENLDDKTRIVYQLEHLAHSPVAAKVLGHMADVVVGYGERVNNVSRVFQAAQAEYKSGYLQSAEPGTITVDADMQTGYIYTQVDMYWNISDYVAEDYAIDYAKLAGHVAACVHALRKYLHGRIGV